MNSLLDNELVTLLRHSTFVRVVAVVAAALTITLAVQAYFFFAAGTDETENRQATVRVNVGEMYFEQVDAGLPQNVLEVEAGDVIEFRNEGNLRHSVTIEELGFDEVVYPGDAVLLEVEETVEAVTVNCKFHPGHDATLNVADATL